MSHKSYQNRNATLWADPEIAKKMRTGLRHAQEQRKLLNRSSRRRYPRPLPRPQTPPEPTPMTDQPKPPPKQVTKAWIVTSPVKPPEDWGFKPNWWHDHYYRVTLSKSEAQALKRDLLRLELNPKLCKVKPWIPTIPFV